MKEKIVLYFEFLTIFLPFFSPPSRIFQYPENLPAIDFSAYKKLLNNPKLVEPFEAGVSF